MTLSDLTIVVCCNRKDYFLARICIASIRYFYPEISIELIKDKGNGDFDTREIEKHFEVSVSDLGVERMGWSVAKFLYLFKTRPARKLLMLDADIVFTGPFLERMLPAIAENDYVVSKHETNLKEKEWIRKTFFEIEKLSQAYPDYEFPGYFFNAGQLFVTTGSIDTSTLLQFFDPIIYPYWKDKEVFPLVDQSVYNYLLPTMERQGKLKLGKEKFMLWALQPEVQQISVEDLRMRKLDHTGVIHWAGEARGTLISQMARADILNFFENYYYSNIPLAPFKRSIRKIMPSTHYCAREIYKRIQLIRELIFNRRRLDLTN